MAPYTDNCTEHEHLTVAPGETRQPGRQRRTLFQQYMAIGRFLWRETMNRRRQRRQARYALPQRGLPSQ